MVQGYSKFKYRWDEEDFEQKVGVGAVLDQLITQIYADGASLKAISKMAELSFVKGFTTNPSLMREAGVESYESFAREMLTLTGDRPVSFEVFADEEEAMIEQALILAKWSPQVYVKIPVTNTRGESTGRVLSTLSREGVKLNVTALFSPRQIEEVLGHLVTDTPVILSIFAGRIADTGRDPKPIIEHAVDCVLDKTNIQILWASCREIWNIMEANLTGCHIITIPHSFFPKLSCLGKNLEQFSLETVGVFHRDAIAANYQIVQGVQL